MASLPLSVLNVQATNDIAKIVRVSANLEVRPHENKQPDQEQIRYILTVDLEQTVYNVSDVFFDTGNSTTDTLRGQVRGYQDIALTFDAEYWNGSAWKLTKDELVGINEDGSTQAVLSQTWVATQAWADAPWNP